MSQDWVANLYTTATVVDTTMSNAELMFATLKSSFAGSSTPSNAAAGQVWYDSNASYKCLQVRDSANAAWRGVMVGSSSCKVWLYLNAVEEGWTIDSSVTDKVLSLKGGSTYVTGASDAQGTWTIAGITTANESAHTHGLNAHVHSLLGTLIIADKTISGSPKEVAYDEHRDKWHVDTGSYDIAGGKDITGMIGPNTVGNSGATAAGSAHNHTVTQDGTWRVAAATGILAAPTARG